MMKRAPLFFLAAGMAALTACAVEAPDEPTSRSRATVCGEERRLGPDGEVVVEPAIFRFAILDEDLAAHPEVADTLGFDTVTTCDEAREASEALLAASEPALAADAEPVVEEPQIIGGTVLTTHRGVIQLSNGCTGMLIGARIAVTAAHCLDQWTDPDTDFGTPTIRIRYYDPTFNGLVDVTNGFEQVTVRIHPNWSGDSDPEDDLGVIVRNTTWNNTTTADYLRIYDHHFGSVGTVKIYGQGFEKEPRDGGTLGTLRVASFGIDWYNSWYSITKATSTKRVCGGDSGAPVIKEVGAVELIAGIHVQSDKASSSDECAKSGGNQRHTRLHPTKIDWIENTTGQACSTATTGGIQYAQCW